VQIIVSLYLSLPGVLLQVSDLLAKLVPNYLQVGNLVWSFKNAGDLARTSSMVRIGDRDVAGNLLLRDAY
jgi:hypothetical protein